MLGYIGSNWPFDRGPRTLPSISMCLFAFACKADLRRPAPLAQTSDPASEFSR